MAASEGTVAGGPLLVEHSLRLFGAHARVLERPEVSEVPAARAWARRGEVVVALLPDAGFCGAFGIEVKACSAAPPTGLLARDGRRLRTLARSLSFHGPGDAVVSSGEDVVWSSLPVEGGGLLLVGTDLEFDLRRLRQGDPDTALRRETRPQWGFPGERPNYLFEPQLDPSDLSARHADRFAAALAAAVARLVGAELPPLLPGGAPGAVVVTGDDDQASLETYARQLELLEGMPVTYFLHPLTRHDTASLEALTSRPRIELALHPDALDTPERYDELLAEQAAWFARLTGAPARAVRNHGYLNDGYWGHLEAWLREGLTISTNIPGLDGRALNGSLLPARVVLGGALSGHWSILTAIGDGVVFALGDDERQAAERIGRLADAIVAESLPGVIVLNLHPQNVESTVGMHTAARDLLARGFLAWTLGECIDWFARRDLRA